jgi:ribonuclease D
MAHPGNTEDSAVLIDPLSTELSLEPLYELFKNPSVVKVFHAARQDLEIFFTDKKIIPFPFFLSKILYLKLHIHMMHIFCKIQLNLVFF